MSGDFTDGVAKDAMMNPGSFDFAKDLGQFIQNREFETGYRNFVNGRRDRTTYIWDALSAMGHDLGEATFSSIRNYIDEVSNVDTCKVKSLNSMIKSFGLVYGGVGQIDKYPVEVLDLLDIFSIDPKFLLHSDKLKKDFAEDIALSCGGFDTLDMERYPEYVKGVFRDLLMSFLELEYNTKQEGVKPIYNYLENEYLLNQKYYDQYFGSSIREFKTKNNISPFFREQEIADAIEQGGDSLDSYTGAEKALLELVFADRARMLASGDVSDASVRAELKTRFSYYRKAKVLEYARFVDDMYALQTMVFRGGYAMDPNYGEVNIGSERVFDYDGDSPRIHGEMVDKVAESLTQTVLYIRKLKLQVRKNYMKGTMNLLTYVINEFLVDYSRTSQTFTQDISSSSAAVETLARIRNELTSSNSRDIELVEYYDTTEYYNLQTGSSGDSVND